MAQIELIMPKLGESVMEATILSWEKSVGDTIELDENVLTIATDKVDTEVPSPVAGVLKEIRFEEGEVVAIGEVIAIIESESAEGSAKSSPAVAEKPASAPVTAPQVQAAASASTTSPDDGRFYSPLVRSIAKEEQISEAALASIPGSGKDGRVTKDDILGYLAARSLEAEAAPLATPAKTATKASAAAPAAQGFKQFTPPPVDKSNADIIAMSRMRKLIAEHMVMSKHVSPHVTSFVEVDVTNLSIWREKVKDDFLKKYGAKLTLTPIFFEAVARALQDFPMVNVSVEGENIIRHRNINLGMAAALPSGDLIVPVIKQADSLNLVGMAKAVTDLATRARDNKLRPDEVQGGTFTVTNVGIFGSSMGTPIINQPQAAILATGEIKKKPAVLETEAGDVIAIRRMMFLSMTYDHRVVDGMLGSKFMRRVADYLEAFDINRAL